MTEETQHARPLSRVREPADREQDASRRTLLGLPFLAEASLAPFATATTLVPPPATAATQPPNTYTEPLGTSLEGWPYPGPLQFLPLTMEGQQVRMAYMDFRSPIRWQMTHDGHEKAKVGIAGQQWISIK
ncbi:hypothetical protein [Bradyrhizobium valentinum]|uniref:hypothetical protein n=1 Tax=Bradyrhizobium valentinum TaxID=1518501 RepID=UPI000A5636E1|nr:hypothetical protein [Bradyrhizobium valentinum]